jgi:hypothetical protein
VKREGGRVGDEATTVEPLCSRRLVHDEDGLGNGVGVINEILT